jgi:hypothetical protein
MNREKSTFEISSVGFGEGCNNKKARRKGALFEKISN